MLVHFEIFTLVADAFAREKQMKAGSRGKKIALIERSNPEWKDLFEKISNGSLEELIRIKNFLR